MARVVIIGASIGGLPAAYECRAMLGKQHKVTVISSVDTFHFVPSNPWVAVGWRTRKDISFALGPVLQKKGIEFVHAAAERIEPQQNRVLTAKGEVLYDFLIIATGPKLNFQAVPGLGPSSHTQSICTVDHADLRAKRLRRKVSIYFVTSEPYVGHMGLAGVGKSRRLMEDELAERSIRPIVN